MTTLNFGFPSIRPLMGEKQELSLGDKVLIRSPSHCFKSGFALSLVGQLSLMNNQPEEKQIFVVFAINESHNAIVRFIEKNISANRNGGATQSNSEILVLSNYSREHTAGQFTLALKDAVRLKQGKLTGVLVDNIDGYVDEHGGSAEESVFNEINAAREEDGFILLVTKHATMAFHDPHKPFGGYPENNTCQMSGTLSHDENYDHSFLLDVTYPSIEHDVKHLHLMNHRKPELGVVSIPFDEHKTIPWDA
tara:strand:- start:3208 stop:3957 length:750 start_codon:yes stop_codon:yes gene_type:complete